MSAELAATLKNSTDMLEQPLKHETMNLFYLNSLDTDPRYCFIDPMISVSGKILMAIPALPKMERLNLEALELQMDEDAGGLELPDYVSNDDNLLPLRCACAEAITQNFDLGEYELLPVKLINEKQRVHSDDYVILNPLGRIDCLDKERSDMDNDEDDPAVQIMGRWLLRARDIPPGRDLFRAVGVTEYIFSERLVAFITSEGFTNFRFLPVIVS